MVKVIGEFDVECVSADGKTLWRERWKNAATTEGRTGMLSDYFAGGSQVSTWYIGIIDNASFTKVDDSDTMSSHGGWQESTSYSESTRQQWNKGSPSAGEVASTSDSVFTFSTQSFVRGVFITSNSTKGGTSGELWATALADTVKKLDAGQQLKVSYTVRLKAG